MTTLLGLIRIAMAVAWGTCPAEFMLVSSCPPRNPVPGAWYFPYVPRPTKATIALFPSQSRYVISIKKARECEKVSSETEPQS